MPYHIGHLRAISANTINPFQQVSIMQNQYGPTLFLSNVANLQTELIRPGQWVKDINCDIRGQYLGKTNSGVIVIRWQNGKFGSKADCKSNNLLRQFAKVNGSK